MTVAGRLPDLKSRMSRAISERSLPARRGMPAWLRPSVPWQVAQAAARLRPSLGSRFCASACAALEANAKANNRRTIRAPRSGFRGGFGHFLFGELERDFPALVDVDRHLAAVRELAEQQLVGEGPADRVLDEPRHRPRAHERIEAALGKMLAQRVGELRLDLLFLELRFELHQELVHDSQDDVVVERAEGDGRVQAVPELGREHALDLRALVARLLLPGEAHDRL